MAQITLPTGGSIQYDYAAMGYSAPTGYYSVNLGSPDNSVAGPTMYALTRQLSERRQYTGGNYVGKTDYFGTSEIDNYDPSGNRLSKQTYTIGGGTLPSSGTNYNPPQYGQQTSTNYYDKDGSTLLESVTTGFVQNNCQVNCATVQTVSS